MGTYNFSFTKGEDYSQELLFRDRDTHVALDIANMEFSATCLDHIDSSLELFDFTFTKNVDPATGKVVMSVAKEITTALAVNAGVYNTFITYTADGRREHSVGGKITFKPEITDTLITAAAVTYVVTVGTDAGTLYGLALAMGSVIPDTYFGTTMTILTGDTAGNAITLSFGGVQLGTYTAIVIRDTTGATASITLFWDSVSAYTAISSDWSALFLANNGSTMSVSLEPIA